MQIFLIYGIRGVDRHKVSRLHFFQTKISLVPLISIRDWIAHLLSERLQKLKPEVTPTYALICKRPHIGWSHHEEWVAIFYRCEFVVFANNHEIDEQSKSILLNNMAVVAHFQLQFQTIYAIQSLIEISVWNKFKNWPSEKAIFPYSKSSSK